MSNENITFFFTEHEPAYADAEHDEPADADAEHKPAEHDYADAEHKPAEHENIPIQLELADYYAQTYNVKQLNQILHYYAIPLRKNKMSKDELIQVLVFYETDMLNQEMVQRRMRLWQNIEELRADPFFKQFILPF
jgi:hypothetical protein